MPAAAYGDYFNGEPGKPLLVSLLLYLNPEWRREWGAETLLLDGQTDGGVFVAPRPCRAVLLDQDILHRVSAPSGECAAAAASCLLPAMRRWKSRIFGLFTVARATRCSVRPPATDVLGALLSRSCSPSLLLSLTLLTLRNSWPAAAAGNRPRFSLVWKLALLPRHPGQQLCLARPEWGPPASIGSAARVDAVKRQMAQEQRRKNQAS